MQPVEAIPFDREEMLERLGGDTALLDDVLVVFLEECPKLFEAVRGAVDEGDPRRGRWDSVRPVHPGISTIEAHSESEFRPQEQKIRLDPIFT